MASTRGRLVGLFVLAAALPAVEEVVLVAVRFHAARALAPQVTAVWPYDSYHDLRWLLVYHDSWGSFGLGLLAVIVLRGLFSALLAWLAWPAGTPRPSGRRLLRRNLVVAVVAALVVSPWAALSVAFSAVALSWYLFASLGPLLVTAPFLARAGVVDRWWRGLPTIELVGWSTLNFAVLTLAGALISSVPGWWPVPVAALAGAANGALWLRVVDAAVRPARVHLPRLPAAPIAIALAVVGAVWAESIIGIATGGQGSWRPPILSQRLPDRVPEAMIVLGGHDSRWDGEPAADPRVERYSYRGLDASGRPRPYRPEATHQSLDTSAAVLAAHVRALHRRTGRPIALVGQSEGAMVIRTYLDKLPRGPVTAAVLFSPLVRAGRTYYPPPGYEGWGVATGWQLRALFWLADLPRPVKNQPDEPFVRSILVDAPFYRNRTLCPVPGVRMIAFLPTVTAAEAPPGEYSHVPVYQMPAFHGGLIGNRSVQDEVTRFLAGEPINRPRREYDLLQRLGSAWQAPSLLLTQNPLWSATREGDPARTGQVCQPR
ncbi:alpha/beta hydrolase [Micromonospora sp. NPDC018662]|uniref:alpha/beta hydrolase n=1 Tax=Micromonospora sp. NPDC018662 TaxID=3364238 RepID=UPI0037A840EF